MSSSQPGPQLSSDSLSKSEQTSFVFPAAASPDKRKQQQQSSSPRAQSKEFPAGGSPYISKSERSSPARAAVPLPTSSEFPAYSAKNKTILRNNLGQAVSHKISPNPSSSFSSVSKKKASFSGEVTIPPQEYTDYSDHDERNLNSGSAQQQRNPEDVADDNDDEDDYEDLEFKSGLSSITFLPSATNNVNKAKAPAPAPAPAAGTYNTGAGGGRSPNSFVSSPVPSSGSPMQQPLENSSTNHGTIPSGANVFQGRTTVNNNANNNLPGVNIAQQINAPGVTIGGGSASPLAEDEDSSSSASGSQHQTGHRSHHNGHRHHRHHHKKKDRHRPPQDSSERHRPSSSSSPHNNLTSDGDDGDAMEHYESSADNISYNQRGNENQSMFSYDQTVAEYYGDDSKDDAGFGTNLIRNGNGITTSDGLLDDIHARADSSYIINNSQPTEKEEIALAVAEMADEIYQDIRNQNVQAFNPQPKNTHSNTALGGCPVIHNHQQPQSNSEHKKSTLNSGGGGCPVISYNSHESSNDYLQAVHDILNNHGESGNNPTSTSGAADSSSPESNNKNNNNYSRSESSDEKEQTKESIEGASNHFRNELVTAAADIHFSLRLEHQRIEHQLENAQRSILFASQEAFIQQMNLRELQYQEQAQVVERQFLEQLQKAQSEERMNRKKAKAIQIGHVRKIRAQETRIHELEEAILSAKAARLRYQQRREAFQMRIAHIEEQQRKERQYLLDAQIRKLSVTRKLYELEIRHLPQWKRDRLMSEQKQEQQQLSQLQRRQSEHLREHQLYQLRHMQRLFEIELNQAEARDNVLAEQRHQVQTMRARHKAEIKAEKVRLEETRAALKESQRRDELERQQMKLRLAQIRQGRALEHTKRREQRARARRHAEEERERDTEFEQILRQTQREHRMNLNGESGMTEDDEENESQTRGTRRGKGAGSHVSRDDSSSVATSEYSIDINSGGGITNLMNFADGNDEQAQNNGQSDHDENGNNGNELGGNNHQAKSEHEKAMADQMEREKAILGSLVEKQKREMEELVAGHQEQVMVMREDEASKLSDIRYEQEEEIKRLRTEHAEEIELLLQEQQEERANTKMASDQIEAVLNAMLDSMIVADCDGIIQMFNKAACELFGYQEKDVIGKNVNILVNDELRDRHQSFIDRFNSTGKGVIIGTKGREVNARHRDGSEIPIMLSVSERMIRGKRLFVACLHDIRVQKMKEETIKAESEKIESIMIAAGPIVVADKNGTIILANPSTERLFGYLPGRLNGMNVADLTEPKVAAVHHQYMERYLNGGKPTVIGTDGREVNALHRDGSIFPVKLTLNHRNIRGEHMFVASIEDLRDVKRRERFLASEQEKMEGVMEAAGPLVVADTQGVIIRANPATERLFGYEKNSLTGHNVSELCEPSVSSVHHMFISRYLAGGEPRVIGTSGREVMARTRDGTLFPVKLTINERKLQNDHFFVATIEDLRDVKRREVESAAERELLQSILAASGPMAVADAKGEIIRCNPATESLFGYEPGSLKGKNVSVLCEPAVADVHHLFMSRYLNGGTPRIIGTGGREVKGLHRNGTLIPLRLTLNVSNYQGQKIFVAIFDVLQQNLKKN